MPCCFVTRCKEHNTINYLPVCQNDWRQRPSTCSASSRSSSAMAYAIHVPSRVGRAPAASPMRLAILARRPVCLPGAEAPVPRRRRGARSATRRRRTTPRASGFQPRRSGDRRVATANAAAFSKLRRFKRRTSVSTPVGAATQRAPLNARDQTADSICAAADREPFGGKDADISKCLHIEFTRQKRCAAKAQAEMRGETNHQVTHGKPSLGP